MNAVIQSLYKRYRSITMHDFLREINATETAIDNVFIIANDTDLAKSWWEATCNILPVHMLRDVHYSDKIRLTNGLHLTFVSIPNIEDRMRGLDPAKTFFLDVTFKES